MAFLALIAVLLIEQVRPLLYRRVVLEPLGRVAGVLEGVFDAGEHRYGMLAWLVGIGGLLLVAGAVHAALAALNPLLAWLWNVAVLYLTLGFRQFSHHFTNIQFALRMDDLPRARKVLGEWRDASAKGLSASEIARLSIEEALAASHRHVFAVLLCFILLGPCGAVLYRAAAFLADTWGRREEAEAGSFGVFARQAFVVIDWLPARATAAVFAIVGNFEDAIYCWRNQVGRWASSAWGGAAGIVLASGAGALGVRLGVPVSSAEASDAAEIGVGETADVDFMQSAVGLVWRALLLWLSLMLLMTFAGLVGG
ncbi:MAG: CobD/CbiB family protein [Propionivibrio sp.]